MASFNSTELDSTELIEAEAHVCHHIFNFMNSYALKCAVELNIPDIIQKHTKPITFSQLSSSLQIHPSKSECLHRLMRLLVHSGFFAIQNVENESGYVLTNASKILVKDHPSNFRQYIFYMLDPFTTKPWESLSTWFGNEDTIPYETAHGMTLWEQVVVDPRMNDLLNDAMASDARIVERVLTDKCRHVFDGLKTLVDVGGGTGTMARAFAKEFSGLECTVLDLLHVIGDLKSEGNVNYVGGDMFQAVPPADAVFLKLILHDWNDEECVNILKNCKEAVTANGKKGKVIIVDIVIPEEKKNEKDDKTKETQLFYDMLMMILTTGKERTEKEWSELFVKAGFSHYKITPVLALKSVIEVYP